MRGLHQVAAAEGIVFAGNAALTNVDGLESLTTVDHVDVRDNGTLLSLHGLAGLRSVGSQFAIRRNSLLPTCELDWLVSTIGRDNLPATIDVGETDDAGLCQASAYTR